MYPSTSPRKERILLTSFNQAFESPPYDDQPLLPQGRQAKGGDIQIKETYHKDGKGLPPQEQATFLPKSEAKGRGASIPQKHFLFIQGSPITQVALNRWYKNERSPRNTLRYYNPKKEYIIGNILTWILHSKIKKVKVI